jgi:hypothetical protein
VVGRLPELDEPLSHLTTNADGVLVAAVCGDRQVVVFDVNSRRKVGEVLFRRDIGGLVFGHQAELAVGLDDGDYNRIDLLSGRASRSEPHRGRGRNNWNFEASMDYAAIRGAVASHRAGGEAIAEYIFADEIEEPKGRGYYLGIGCALLVFTCGGCGVFGFFLRYMGYL